MVTHAQHQNGFAGEQDFFTDANNHIKHQDLTKLSPGEKKLLNNYEKVIEKHLAAFFEVGSALLNIRDGKI